MKKMERKYDEQSEKNIEKKKKDALKWEEVRAKSSRGWNQMNSVMKNTRQSSRRNRSERREEFLLCLNVCNSSTIASSLYFFDFAFETWLNTI